MKQHIYIFFTLGSGDPKEQSGFNMVVKEFICVVPYIFALPETFTTDTLKDILQVLHKITHQQIFDTFLDLNKKDHQDREAAQFTI